MLCSTIVHCPPKFACLHSVTRCGFSFQGLVETYRLVANFSNLQVDCKDLCCKMSDIDINIDPEDGSRHEERGTVGSSTGRAISVPSLSSLCFPSIQTLSLQPIDLTTPLPVTRIIGPLTGDTHDRDESEEFVSLSSQPQHQNGSIPTCLKSRRLKCRKEAFYKMGLRSHWFEQKKLIGAVQNYEISKVSEMLETGADPNVSDQKKRTPLHIAASQGQDYIVGLLLSKRADPNRQDILGNTPLHLAVCKGDLATIKVLIENGSNIYRADNNGRTPLSLVRNRLGGLRRSKTASTDAFKTEFLMISELFSSPASRLNDRDSFINSIDHLCDQMQTVSTREKADEITDATIQHMGNAVSALSLSKITLL